MKLNNKVFVGLIVAAAFALAACGGSTPASAPPVAKEVTCTVNGGPLGLVPQTRIPGDLNPFDGTEMCSAEGKWVKRTSVPATPVPVNTKGEPVLVPTPKAPVAANNCNNSFWGSAGEAPQALNSAWNLMGVVSATKEAMTQLFPGPGDTRVIGWAVGTRATEIRGDKFVVTVPAGVTVDYDPNVTTIKAETAWVVEFLPTWHKAMIAKTGSISSVKLTVWWTCYDNGPRDKYKLVSGTLP